MWFGIIGLNGTCLLILLVFVEPPWIPPRSRLKQEPPRARRAPPPSAAIKRISKYASSNRERRWSKKRRAVKRLRAFSVVPLLRPRLRLCFFGGRLPVDSSAGLKILQVPQRCCCCCSLLLTSLAVIPGFT